MRNGSNKKKDEIRGKLGFFNRFELHCRVSLYYRIIMFTIIAFTKGFEI